MLDVDKPEDEQRLVDANEGKNKLLRATRWQHIALSGTFTTTGLTKQTLLLLSFGEFHIGCMSSGLVSLQPGLFLYRFVRHMHCLCFLLISLLFIFVLFLFFFLKNVVVSI